jgi:hypothetical protein
VCNRPFRLVQRVQPRPWGSPRMWSLESIGMIDVVGYASLVVNDELRGDWPAHRSIAGSVVRSRNVRRLRDEQTMTRHDVDGGERAEVGEWMHDICKYSCKVRLGNNSIYYIIKSMRHCDFVSFNRKLKLRAYWSDADLYWDPEPRAMSMNINTFFCGIKW